jgi:hypothetical protein
MAVLDATIKAIAAAKMQSSFFISPRRTILDQKKECRLCGRHERHQLLSRPV